MAVYFYLAFMRKTRIIILAPVHIGFDISARKTILGPCKNCVQNRVDGEKNIVESRLKRVVIFAPQSLLGK